MSEIQPTFHGELQLAGWSESHNGGCKVTFWLSDPSDLDAFRALTVRKGNQAGQRFMAALVEVGDDEQPVPPPVDAAQEPERAKGGALARLCGLWCNDQEFWLFLRANGVRCASADEAAEIVRKSCGIESRAELDHDEIAGRLFNEKFRSPFMAWRRMEGR